MEQMLNCSKNKIILLILLIIFCGGCKNPEQKKTQHFERGIDYLSNDNPRAAALELRNAIKIDPKFADAYYQLGLAYIELKAPRFAYDYLEKAAELDPDNLDALLKSAEILFLAGEKQESWARLKKIMDSTPSHVDALILAANIELSDNNLRAAQEFINKALDIRPGLDRIHRLKARLHLAERNFKELEGTLNKAVAAGPQNKENYKALLSYYLDIFDMANAEKVLLDTISAFPEDVEPHLELAKLYLRQGKKDKGEKSIANAISVRPNDPALYLKFGDFLKEEGNTDDAEKAYRQALSLTEEPLDVKAALADFYFSQNKIDLAEQEVDSVLAENREHNGGLMVKAKLKHREKKYEEALESLEGLLLKDPGWADAFYQKALVYLELNDFVLSERSAERAVLLNPDHAKAHTLLADLLLRKGKYKEAGWKALLALQKKPDNLSAGIIYTQSLLKQKQIDLAMQVLEKMKFWFPDDIEVMQLQGFVLVAQQEFSKALSHFQKIINKEPGYIPAIIAVVEICDRLKMKKTAIDMLRKQNQILPDNPDIMMLLGSQLYQEKMHDEALQIYQKLQKVIPDDPNAYLMEASIQKETGIEQNSLDKYRSAIRGKEISPSILLSVGTLYEMKGDFYGAKDVYRKALELDPDFALAANNLAWLILHDDIPDLDEALDLAIHARKIDTDNPHISDTLGMVHLKRGFYYLAAVQFNRSVETDPENPLYRYHHAIALKEQGDFEKARKELEYCLSLEKEFPERDEAKKLLKEINNQIAVKRKVKKG